MNINPTLSIIIPVYNVEKYLLTCVNSVLTQTSSDYEIILVDDGSIDNSGNICDDFVHIYKNIKVIHKKNGGLSDARNIGLESAHGRYIVFLDSDDYWDDKKLIEKIISTIQESSPDLIVFGYEKIYSNGKHIDYQPLVECDTVTELTKCNEFITCAWDKVIKKDILIENNIRFEKGVYSEDMEWCAKLFLNSISCKVIKQTPYMYRQREGSITKRVNEKNVSDIYHNYLKCEKIRENIESQRKEAFECYLSRNFSMFLIVLSSLEQNEQRKYYSFIRTHKNILKASNRKREILIYYALLLCGENITEKLLLLIYRKRNRY